MSRERTMKALSDFLRPEFLSRVDEVVVFKPLSEESLLKIAALMMEEMRTPLHEKGIELSYTDAALKLMAEKSGGGKFGARDLRRTIRKEIEDRIAEKIVQSGGAAMAAVKVDAENGEVKLVAE